MATLGNTYINLADAFKSTIDGKQAAALIDVLVQQNAILDDAIAIECNMGTFHRHMIRTGLPSVAWGALYKGTPQSKSIRQQVDDTTGFLEGLSSVDKRLLKITPNAGALRMQEASGFLEAMNQEVSTGIFYHSTAASPEKFKGLNARYGVLNGSGPGNQIIDAGGVGADNTSIWFVTWGEQFTTLLYPFTPCQHPSRVAYPGLGIPTASPAALIFSFHSFFSRNQSPFVVVHTFVIVTCASNFIRTSARLPFTM